MDNMDGFSFLFNNEGLFNFKDNDKKEETATGELNNNEQTNAEIKLLKESIHVKNQIILRLLGQCDTYAGIVAEIIKSASNIPDMDVQNKIGGVTKAFDTNNKLNEMLKMAIEFEEGMDL